RRAGVGYTGAAVRTIPGQGGDSARERRGRRDLGSEGAAYDQLEDAPHAGRLFDVRGVRGGGQRPNGAIARRGDRRGWAFAGARRTGPVLEAGGPRRGLELKFPANRPICAA